MPLIPCPDCGNSVSDRANTCVHCGAPLELRGGLLTVFFRQNSPNHKLNEETAVRLCTDAGGELARFVKSTIVTLSVPCDMKVHTETPFPFPNTKGEEIPLSADRHTYLVLRVEPYVGNLIPRTDFLGEKPL